MSLWPWMKVKVIRLRKEYVGLESDYLHSNLDGHCLKSFWNNQIFIIFTFKIFEWRSRSIQWTCDASSFWGSHRAKFDGDDFSSSWWIVCEGHTHTQFGLVYCNLFQSCLRLWKQKWQKSKQSRSLPTALVKMQTHTYMFTHASTHTHTHTQTNTHTQTHSRKGQMCAQFNTQKQKWDYFFFVMHNVIPTL